MHNDIISWDDSIPVCCLVRTVVDWNEDRRHDLGEGEEETSRPEEGIQRGPVC